ncbi:UvrB/UvrC motif-containing protein [Oscillospiraceae bacterium LCP25S3_E10]|nr:UvrB/UvrC motif-containing protein [Ruminococcus sp.]MDD6446446.1 UvrB/UvrC motif-containing protein [Ruminococcus sp.]MDY2856300.1 UvrB/UvrC motif-containing protein [Oscillospiraceae bacterium]
MICELCGKNQATTHVKSMVNGEYTEMWLCPHCAKEKGFGSLFAHTATDFSSFLGSFFGDGLPSRTSATRCKSCGSSFADIARSGKVGCADCYTNFYDELLPSIQKIHGNIQHTGKVVAGAGADLKLSREIEKTRQELAQAVKEQNFELAAKLRDKINDLEAGDNNAK